MKKEESESYVPPTVEVVIVNVEKGYAATSNPNSPTGGDVIPWE